MAPRGLVLHVSAAAARRPGQPAEHRTANLDAAATAIDTALNPWDAQDPANTANFSTTMTVYDSLGNGHTLDVYFRKSDTVANTWDYHVIADGDDVVGGTPGQNFEIGTGGQMQFTTNGALNTITGAALTIDFNNATAAQAITLDFGTPIGAGGTGLDGTTQFAGKSNVSSQSQDGYASGDFSGVAIDGTGVVQGVHERTKRAMAQPRSQVPLQRRRGPRGAEPVIETRDSGTGGEGTAGRRRAPPVRRSEADVDLAKSS